MRKSWVRVGITLAITILAISAIGFGGLAGWSVSTPNAATVFAGGAMSLVDSNTNGTCTATITTTPATGCPVIFTSANVILGPGDSATGTVTITNNGNLPITLSLAEATPTVAPSGSTMCSDLGLTITGAGGHVWTASGASLASFATGGAVTLKPTATPMAPAGTDTYSFVVTLAGGASTADSGATCSAAFTFTATSA